MPTVFLARPMGGASRVDDDHDVADSLGVLLRVVLAYDVCVAYSGESATEIAGEYRPDIVILDLNMPGSTAPRRSAPSRATAACCVRRSSHTPQPPIPLSKGSPCALASHGSSPRAVPHRCRR